jgi:7-keto-8-aminopelargonate synthetase-like enzyme
VARSPFTAIWKRRSRDSFGTESSLTFVAAWNANEALTSTVLEEGDFVVSDALNHASIIDSIRLAKSIVKCTSAVYKHADLDDLVAKLEQAKGAKRRLIWTDGVFSMEGAIAKLPDLIDIARRHNAVLAVDDSHSTGVLGETGRGTAEHFGVLGEVGHHHVDAGQGAGWRGGWLRGRLRGALRHADAAVAPTAVLERPPADRCVQRACRDRVRREASGPRGDSPRKHAVLS